MKKITFFIFLFIFVGAKLFADLIVSQKNFIATTSVTLTSLVTNFDWNISPNLWAGIIGSFKKDESIISLTHDSASPLQGKCLGVTYDNRSTSSYCGVFVKLAPENEFRDISSYKYLSFKIKGNTINQGLKIQLRNKSSNISRNFSSVYINDYLDSKITTNWQEVNIPLAAFANLDTLTNVTEIVYVFEYSYEDICGMIKSGKIFLDDIKFENYPVNVVRIDHFGDKYGLNALGGNIGTMTGGGGIINFSFSNTMYHNYSYSLKINYSLRERYSWCGIFMIFGGGQDGWTPQPLNFSNYSKIVFYLRAESNTQRPDFIKIEILDNSGIHHRYIAVPEHTSWLKYVVRLSDFSELNKSEMKQLNIIFERSTIGPNLEGIVYIDEIQFE